MGPGSQTDAAGDPRPDATRTSRTTVAASCLGGAVLVLAIAGLPLAALGHQLNWSNVEWLAVMAPFGAVGFLVAWRQPRNPLGWLLLATAAVMLLQTDADYYVTFDYIYRHHHLVGGALAVFFAVTPPFQVPVAFLMVLFPAGHLPSPRWKWLLGALSVAGVVTLIGSIGRVAQAFLDHHRIRVGAATGNLELGRVGRGWSWASHDSVILGLLTGVVIVCWLVHHVSLYRRSTGDYRLQMKWLLTGALTTVASGALLVRLSSSVGPHTPWWLYAVLGASELGLAALPACFGVAILRFRLYDIDRVISRTLSYAILTALVVGVYVGVVTLVTKGIGFSSPVGVAASTLAAAALFNPFRKHLQRGVDRRFNRARYDAERTVTTFAGRLRESVDPTSVGDDLIDVVHAVFQPASASLWIRGGPGGSKI